MSPRVTWKGSLNVSLVSLAVKAYTATAPENGQLRLNQLHAACHGRIKYEKTCPLHGPVASDQIVMGYQYAQDQYEECHRRRPTARTAVTASEPDRGHAAVWSHRLPGSATR